MSERRNYFIKEINQNDLTSKKHKNVCIASAVNICVAISVFASLVGFPVRIVSSAVGLNIYAINAGIKNHQSIIKKKKHGKMVLLAKTKLNSIEVLMLRAQMAHTLVMTNLF